MSGRSSRLVSSGGLVVGSALGMAGTFVQSTHVRAMLWGLDGVALVVATALLAVHYLRKGSDVVAAGFFVFVVGQALVLASAAMDLAAGGPMFGAGASLWAVSLCFLSLPRVAPLWSRIVGGIAALLFAVVAVEILAGQGITALSKPLPFVAYPFLVAALLGWAWERFRDVA